MNAYRPGKLERAFNETIAAICYIIIFGGGIFLLLL